MVRVLSFSNNHRNPYFRLFYEALAPYGVSVRYTGRTADMLAALRSEAFDVLHLHWSIERLWANGGSRSERIACAVRGGDFCSPFAGREFASCGQPTKSSRPKAADGWTLSATRSAA